MFGLDPQLENKLFNFLNSKLKQKELYIKLCFEK